MLWICGMWNVHMCLFLSHPHQDWKLQRIAWATQFSESAERSEPPLGVSFLNSQHILSLCEYPMIFKFGFGTTDPVAALIQLSLAGKISNHQPKGCTTEDKVPRLDCIHASSFPFRSLDSVISQNPEYSRPGNTQPSPCPRNKPF